MSQFCSPAVIQSCNMKAAFTDPCPFEGDSCSRTRWEHTHGPEPSAVSVNHTLTAPPFFLLFISLFIFFFFFSFLQCGVECSLYRVAGVHWSNSTPMSHTHPMCLLLATLTKRGRERPMERKKQSQKERAGGGGEESEEFDMLCAWVTCIKQRRSK